MAHTYIRLYFHLTFHTKSNTPILKEDIKPLHAYMSGIFKKYQIVPLIVGGVGDHIHAVIHITDATFDFASIVRDLKTSTNRWLKERNIIYHKFAWRRGYGLFTVSYDKLNYAVEYVRNQVEHHRTKTARDEYLDFLRKMRIEFDEKYAFSDD
ncbi:MAG: transposase [Muribaculaceae bacterium]|nr:transposase [Muribaculaceae bacterium]MDE6645171.1 transposase [Muribaculaceae bacterium]